MKRWTKGLICLFSLVVVFFAFSESGFASEFSISVPVELRNIPTSAGPLTIRVGLVSDLSSYPHQFLEVKDGDSEKFIINPPSGVSIYDFVQTVTFNLDILPPYTPFEVGGYVVEIRYEVGTYKILLDTASFIDQSKPHMTFTSGAINKQ